MFTTPSLPGKYLHLSNLTIQAGITLVIWHYWFFFFKKQEKLYKVLFSWAAQYSQWWWLKCFSSRLNYLPLHKGTKGYVYRLCVLYINQFPFPAINHHYTKEQRFWHSTELGVNGWDVHRGLEEECKIPWYLSNSKNSRIDADGQYCIPPKNRQWKREQNLHRSLPLWS